MTTIRPEDYTATGIQQEILEKYPNVAKASGAEEVVFSNENLKFEGDKIEKTSDKKTPAQAFTENLKKKLIEDEESVGIPKEKLTPQNLKKYLDENVTDTKLREEIDGYIKEIEAVDDPVKYLDMFGKNDLKDMILNVYVKEELRKAEDELTTLWAEDQTSNFTTKLDNLRNGKYKDKDGNIKERASELKPYPQTPYQAAALQVYQNEVIPNEMETTLRQSLLKLEQEGYLKDLTNEDLVMQAAIQQKSVDNRKIGEDMVDKEYEKYVRKHSGLAGIAKRHETVKAKREELTHVKKEDVKKALSDKTFKAIEGCFNENTDNKDGTYDISALSDVLLAGIGNDYTLSRSKDELRAELANIAVLLQTGVPARNIKPVDGINAELLSEKSNGSSRKRDKVIKELAKYCGFDVEGRDHTPRLWKAAKQTAEAIAVGGAAHCIAPNVRDIIINNNVVAEIDINIDGVLEHHKIIEVFTNEKITIPMCFNLLQSLGTSAAAGLAISVLEDLIFGNDIEFEKTCFNTDFASEFPNKSDYINFLKTYDKTNNTNTYSRIKFLLDKFEEKERPDGKGNWDYEEFQKLLRMIAGLGSNLNCAEIAGAKMYPGKVEYDPVDEEHKIYISTREVEDTTKPITEPVPVSEDDPDAEQIFFTDGVQKTSWTKLAEDIYDCNADGNSLAQKYGLSAAIRMLKIAQAIEDEKLYSEENLVDLEKQSRRKGGLKGVPGINYGVYQNMLLGNVMPEKLKLPKILAGVERCEVTPEKLTAPPASKPRDGHVVIRSGEAAVGQTTINKNTGKYEQKIQFGVGEAGSGASWYDDVESLGQDVQTRLNKYGENRTDIENLDNDLNEFNNVTNKKEEEKKPKEEK